MRLYYPEKDVDKSKSEAEQEQVGLATVSLKGFVPSRSGQEKADPWGRLCKRKGDGERPSNAFPYHNSCLSLGASDLSEAQDTSSACVDLGCFHCKAISWNAGEAGCGRGLAVVPGIYKLKSAAKGSLRASDQESPPLE